MSEYACMGLVSLLPLLVWLIRLLSLATYTPPPTNVTADAPTNMTTAATTAVTCGATGAFNGQSNGVASFKHGVGLASSSSTLSTRKEKDKVGIGQIMSLGTDDGHESDRFHEGVVDLWIHCVYGVCILYVTWLFHTLYLTNAYTTLLISISVLCTLYYTLYMNSKNSVYDVNYHVGYIVSVLSILLILLCILYIISFGLAYMLTLILTPIVYALILYIIKLN